jgi:hypothetical protein
MAPLGYIEVLDAKGHVTERMRIDSFPITVGRAYSNHVVVDDPYVCPAHLAIEPDEQGRLIARDLNSVNGLRANMDGKRVGSLEVQSGTLFRIGHTLMRYRSIDYPLAPTLIDRENGASRLASPYVAACAGLVVFLLLCLDSFLGTVERVTVAKVVSEPLTTFSTLLIWSGLWSLASRIVVSRLHFFEHATIAGCAIASFSVLSALAEWVEFLFPAFPALWIAGIFGIGLILAGLVYGHLRFASTMRRRSRLWAALLVSTAMVGVSVISDYAGRSKFSNVMEFTGIVKPIDAAWLPTISIDRFIDNNQRLKSELDALAQKAKATQP